MTSQLPFFLAHIWLIPMFPLITAAAMLFFGRRLNNDVINGLCVGSVFLSFIFSAGSFLQLLSLPQDNRIAINVLFEWLPAVPFHMLDGRLANFVADWGFQLDPLSAVMILVVTGVGFLIHVYATGYMAHEGGYYRFFGYLNLFMFAMLMLVLANNFLLLFVGWEGVGIVQLFAHRDFYFHKKSASDAGKKAFIVNRIGDAAFLLGIFMTSALLGTIRFADIGPALAKGNFNVGDPRIVAIALLFFVGATGISAQIPLYVWLADAMEGPTPASARSSTLPQWSLPAFTWSRAPAPSTNSPPPQWPSSLWSAPSPRSSPPRWASCKPTSKKFSRIPPSRNSATCFSLAAWAPSPPEFFI